jgi:rhamnopyranosyl-N-acetylglucosaminyl-diphospho-decaprenol beta-1,3/1,4-galactofuranosyltransferase
MDFVDIDISQEAALVTAVVVTHNRPEELKMVVAALMKQTVSVGRVIVIDNASPMPASDVLVNFPNVEVVRSELNTGGAGGFAFAMQVALEGSCKWIWMMDDDAVPREDALSALMYAAKSLPESAGALCSAVYEFDHLATMHRRTFNFKLGLERSVSAKFYLKDFQQIDMGSFVGFMVRSSAAREVGLPTTSFFIAYDDSEYSLRLKKAGWSLWLIPKSCINHLRTEQSRLRTSNFGLKHFYNIRNRLVVVRMYSDWLTVSACVATIYGAVIWLASKNAISYSSLRQFLKAVRDGWNGILGKVD